MKLISCLYFLLIITVVFSGCISNESTLTPIWTETQPPSLTSTPIHLISAETLVHQSKKTPIPTPIPTLDSGQAQETIRTLLQKPADCAAPCFWGITPEQSILNEVKNIFTHLGLEVKHTNTRDTQEFYEIRYDLDSGLSSSAILSIQNDIVKKIRVLITPEKHKTGVIRQWLAYSPETLINRYGPPSRVDFSIAWGPGTSSFFEMVMYFKTVDLIVEYGAKDIIPWRQKSSPQICPLTSQFEIVRLWLGKDPVNRPADYLPLEEATIITMEEFSKLMTDIPDKACFKLKGEMFP